MVKIFRLRIGQQDEGMKHGNTEITEWAQHEDESHDARYGAENL